MWEQSHHKVQRSTVHPCPCPHHLPAQPGPDPPAERRQNQEEMNCCASVGGGVTMHTGTKAREAAGHSSPRIPPPRCSSSTGRSPALGVTKPQCDIKASPPAKLGIFLAIPTHSEPGRAFRMGPERHGGWDELYGQPAASCQAASPGSPGRGEGCGADREGKASRRPETSRNELVPAARFRCGRPVL